MRHELTNTWSQSFLTVRFAKADTKAVCSNTIDDEDDEGLQQKGGRRFRKNDLLHVLPAARDMARFDHYTRSFVCAYGKCYNGGFTNNDIDITGIQQEAFDLIYPHLKYTVEPRTAVSVMVSLTPLYEQITYYAIHLGHE